MTAVLSVTYDDLYLFNLPFAVYSWHKVNAGSLIIAPYVTRDAAAKVEAVDRCMRAIGCHFRWKYFASTKDKEATYAQCARLYAASIPYLDVDETLVTADADMCVFDPDFWHQFEGQESVNIIGADLVPENQVPMCYITAPVFGWWTFMKIRTRRFQQCLDDLLDGIETDNFRGNYWAKDQEEAYNRILAASPPILKHNRAIPGTQLASRRADRDGWPASIPTDIIDAHLPRPGNTPENFAKIKKLFATMYPGCDLRWMQQYYEEYHSAAHD